MREDREDRVGLILCDARRAKAWRAALARARIAARVEDTVGAESEDGAFKVTVARRDLPAANAIVTAVTRGELALPHPGVDYRLVIAILAIAALVAAVAFV